MNNSQRWVVVSSILIIAISIFMASYTYNRYVVATTPRGVPCLLDKWRSLKIILPTVPKVKVAAPASAKQP